MTAVNERLRSAMAQRGVTTDALAAACDVDPKTVGRWLSGRVPHPRHRWSVANHLAVEEAGLWSTAAPADAHSPQSGMVASYPNRASVPRDLWLALLMGAQRHIDVLVFSGTFFAQSNPHVAAMLAERSRAGAKIRLCFGDPTGQAVSVRDSEEGLGGTLAAKIRASLTYYRTLTAESGCEVRLHDSTLYSSLFRYDDQLLANPHIWGQPASANPLLHLERTPGIGWFDQYTGSFDAVWATSRPWSGIPEPQE
jgi:hypothetical protein